MRLFSVVAPVLLCAGQRLLWLTWISSCKEKTCKKGDLTSHWCVSSPQPRGVRRRSFFGANVAHFVGRQCAGDTTRGVTPPRPPLSLDPLSGMPCMVLTTLCGESTVPGGALFLFLPLHKHQFLSSTLHDKRGYSSSRHRDRVSALHVSSFLQTHFLLSSNNWIDPFRALIPVKSSVPLFRMALLRSLLRSPAVLCDPNGQR